MKTRFFISLLFVLVTGLTANAQYSNKENESAKTIKNDVHLEGMNINKAITMSGGTLHIEGANNTVAVTGFADYVYIEGANVTVTIDRVNRVKIEGANSRVLYKSTGNKNGKVPAEVFGLNSGISRIK